MSNEKIPNNWQGDECEILLPPNKKRRLVKEESHLQRSPIFSLPIEVEILKKICPTDKTLSSFLITCKYFNAFFSFGWKSKFVEWLAEGELTYTQWKNQYCQRMEAQGFEFNEDKANWFKLYHEAQKRSESYAKILYSHLYLKLGTDADSNNHLSESHFKFERFDNLLNHLSSLKNSIEQLNQDNHGNGLVILKRLFAFYLDEDPDVGPDSMYGRKIFGPLDEMNITLLGLYIYLLDLQAVRFLIAGDFSSLNEEYIYDQDEEPTNHIIMAYFYEFKLKLTPPMLEKALNLLCFLLQQGLDIKRFGFVGDIGGILTYLVRYAHQLVDINQVRNIVDLMPDNYFTEIVQTYDNEKVYALHELVEEHDTAEKKEESEKKLLCRNIFTHILNTKRPVTTFFSKVKKEVKSEDTEQFMQQIHAHRTNFLNFLPT